MARSMRSSTTGDIQCSALGLLVHLVPGDVEDVGKEALDQAVAADDLAGVLAAAVGELSDLFCARVT